VIKIRFGKAGKIFLGGSKKIFRPFLLFGLLRHCPNLTVAGGSLVDYLTKILVTRLLLSKFSKFW